VVNSSPRCAQKKHSKEGEHQHQQQQQEDYYHRLIHQCRKDLNKQLIGQEL